MKKILIIEDEASLQKTLGDTLKAEGFEVVAAIDGEIGLKMAKIQKFDLILLDLVLPKILGLEVLAKLKQDPETMGFPVIILTNSEEIQSVERALEMGAVAYLIKSNYSLTEVIGKIKKALGA